MKPRNVGAIPLVAARSFLAIGISDGLVIIDLGHTTRKKLLFRERRISIAAEHVPTLRKALAEAERLIAEG